MLPRSSTNNPSEDSSADAAAAVRAAAATSRERLAALVAAARRVLAALAADPSAVQTGPHVGGVGSTKKSKVNGDDADAMDEDEKKATSTSTSTTTTSGKKPQLVLALSDAVEDLIASRAALRASIKDLKVAEESAHSQRGEESKGKGSNSSSSSTTTAQQQRGHRSAEAAALEPAVAALRDEVRRKNSAVAAMADSLAALVSDVDSWRVAGPGAWPTSAAGDAAAEE